MQLMHIVIPKAMGGDKLQRRATLSVCKKSAWIDSADMIRLTKLSVQDIISRSADYHLVSRLISLDKAWPEFEFAYAKYPDVYNQGEMLSDPFGKIAYLLLKKGRRPSDLIALMDTSMLRFLLEITQQESSTVLSVQPVCALCGVSDPRLRCSACKELGCIEVFYCSKGCQTADWKAHRKMCCKTRMLDTDRMKALMSGTDDKARVKLLGSIRPAV